LKNAHLIYGSSKFDVVTANPPYMCGAHDRKSASAEIAIAKHEIMCTLQDVLISASRIVKSRGRFAMVHRPQRLTDIVCQMRAVHLEPKRIRFVHPKKGSPANMVLIEAVKDGGMDATVLEPLFVYEKPNVYTEDILRIYAYKG
jgi:tRNA1(Val) A37 N6-methylase TrmN6